MLSKPIILKLGGSLVVPNEIDTLYLKAFRALIRKHIKRGKRFIIIVGGGYTNRWYRDQAQALGVINTTDLHWIGTIATQLNAELVRSLFGALAHPRTYCDYTKKILWRKPILVVGGNAPGHSTDHDAVLMARKFGSQTIINMTNVTHLYTKDPKKHRDALPLHEVSWKQYRAMFGNMRRHAPGANIPIDAVAARHSQKHRIETYYVGGEDIKNLDRLLSGKPWKGTRIFSDS